MIRFILLFAVIAVLMSLVLLVPGYSEPGPQQVVEMPQARAVEEPLTDEQHALQDRIEELGEGFAGEVGIAVQELRTGRAIHYLGDEFYPQQSVSKLWVALTALEAADRGKLDFAEPVEIRAADLTLFHQPIRQIVTSQGVFRSDYADLLERALTRSDNTANDRLLRRAGGVPAVESYLARHDIDGVRFGADERTKQSAIAGLTWRQEYALGRRFYDARDAVDPQVRRAAYEDYLADPIDGATPLGIVSAFARLAHGELLSASSTETMLATLRNTRSGPQRLKGGTPQDWTIAHKTGTGQALLHEQTGYNDVGLLTSPEGRRYAVAVMIRRTEAGYPARYELMQGVVRAIVAYDEALAAELASEAEDRESADGEAAESDTA